ncbi:MAG: aminodeoxychorismate synthase component I, partial [Mariprofundaceae bacterium]|nr:aminodeoxychorismate synthase component I [Mariprofundaceae bacterium]
MLEDPSRNGRQFLTSRRGIKRSLDTVCISDAESFFDEWAQRLHGNVRNSPAVRCLIYASYEAGNLIEQLPEPESAPPCTVLWTLYPDESLCFDPGSGHIHLAAASQSQLDALEAMLDQASAFENISATIPKGKMTATSDAAYQTAVERVKAYIAAGDVFQA